MKKTLKDLYKSQYGQTPYFIKYDSILDDVIREDYWKLFEINYFELNTIDLLDLLNVARKNISQINERTSEDAFLVEKEKLNKIISALKNELATREHVPNKLERKAIRQQKMIDKKHR